MPRPKHLGRIALFSFTDDPLTARPIKKSHSYVERLITEGRAEWLNANSAQLLPPREYLEDRRNFVTAGTFGDAWRIELSGGVMPTWQLQTA